MQKLKNNEARPKFTGPYKKKRRVYRDCSKILKKNPIGLLIINLLGQTSTRRKFKQWGILTFIPRFSLNYGLKNSAVRINCNFHSSDSCCCSLDIYNFPKHD